MWQGCEKDVKIVPFCWDKMKKGKKGSAGLKFLKLIETIKTAFLNFNFDVWHINFFFNFFFGKKVLASVRGRLKKGTEDGIFFGVNNSFNIENVIADGTVLK